MEDKEQELPLTDSERLVLLKEIPDFHEEIDNELTAPGMTELRRKAWKEITSQFISMYPDQYPRSIKQLERNHDHVKRKMQDVNREFKKRLKTTFGGPPPATPQPKDDLAKGRNGIETFTDTPDVIETEGRTSPLPPDEDPSVSFLPSTILPSALSLPPPGVIITPAKPATSKQVGAAPHQRKRFPAKDNAYYCLKRQEEYYKLKISQMKEIQDLEAEERKLVIQKNKMKIHNLKKMNLALHDILGKIRMVYDAKKSYESMVALG